MLCWRRARDLRASDAYLLHKRAFREYADAWGGIIDNGVLQRLGNQLVVAPQVMHQTARPPTSRASSTRRRPRRCSRSGASCRRARRRRRRRRRRWGGTRRFPPPARALRARETHAEEGVSFAAGSRAYVSPDGERLNANTAVEAFGGLEAFLRIARLGEGGARR